MIGKSIQLKGLKSRQDLNGQKGKVISFDATRERSTIRLQDGTQFALKAENLTLLESTRVPTKDSNFADTQTMTKKQMKKYVEKNIVAPVRSLVGRYDAHTDHTLQLPLDTMRTIMGLLIQLGDFHSRLFSTPDIQVQIIPALDRFEKEHPGEKPVLFRLFQSSLEFQRACVAMIYVESLTFCTVFVLRKDIQPPRF